MFFIFYFLNRFQNSHLYIQTCQTEHWYTGSIAMLYFGGNSAAPLVQHSCTVGFPMPDLWFSYAGPLVHLCWTFGTRVLHFSGTNCFTGKY